MDLGLTVEEADAVMGKPFGIPKTGIFGLIDLVGLDLMPHVSKSLQTTLPKTDAYQAIYRAPDLFKRMIDEGYTGRKGKGGFYRINREAGKRKEAIDFKTGEYRPQIKVDPRKRDAEASGPSAGPCRPRRRFRPGRHRGDARLCRLAGA